MSVTDERLNLNWYKTEVARLEGELDKLRELADAERDGRCVVLPKPEEYDYDGLKVKYLVFKARNNTPVENCFVLRPDKDPAAIQALMSYSVHTENKQLAADISNWIEHIIREEAENALKGADNERD